MMDKYFIDYYYIYQYRKYIKLNKLNKNSSELIIS